MRNQIAAVFIDRNDDADVVVLQLARRAQEHQIARLICQGKLNKEIAWSIGISEYTVENHLRRIYRKLDVHNRANLAAKFAQSLH